MKKRILVFRAVIGLCLALTLLYSDAFARDGGRDGGHYGGRDSEHYHYRDGRWYRPGLLGFDIAVSALAIGSLIDSLPPRHTTVVVGGVPYYYYDNYYYRPYYGGYVVVPPPIATQPIIAVPPPPPPVVINAPMPSAQYQTQGQDTVTINIPNASGSYTAVTLRKSGNGFVGPQGEYYTENPTVDQLKTLYGK